MSRSYEARMLRREARLKEQEEMRRQQDLLDIRYMKEALRQAARAAALGEVPIGCVIVHDGKIIGRGYNRRNTDKSTLSHAEITAIRKASKAVDDWRLEDCTLYVNRAKIESSLNVLITVLYFS